MGTLKLQSDGPLYTAIRHPCSDFTDMLRRLISCRIIIIISKLAVDGWAVYIWYSEEGTGQAAASSSPILAVDYQM